MVLVAFRLFLVTASAETLHICHGMPQDATGCHGDATGCHRMPRGARVGVGTLMGGKHGPVMPPHNAANTGRPKLRQTRNRLQDKHSLTDYYEYGAQEKPEGQEDQRQVKELWANP